LGIRRGVELHEEEVTFFITFTNVCFNSCDVFNVFFYFLFERLFTSVVYFSDASGQVRFWHCSSRKCLVLLNENRAQTMSLAFSGPPADKFVTVGADPKVFVYDVDTKKRVAELEAT